MDAWRRLLLAVVCGVAVASVYAAQPVLEPMGGDLGVPPGLIGWIVATGQLGYLVGLVVLVPLGDLVDRRRLIAGHLALTAVGSILTAAAPTGWPAFVGLAVAGAFAVVVQTTVAYAASVSPPAERGRTIGIVTSGVVIGILGARIVTGLLADVWGWRSVYAVIAVLALVLAAPVLVRASVRPGRPSRPAGYGQALASLGGLFGERLLLTRGLIAFFLFASFGTLWSGLSLPLAAAPWQLTESQIGLFGIAGLAGASALLARSDGRMRDGRLRSLASPHLALHLVGIDHAAVRGHCGLLVVGVVVLDFAVQAVHVSSQHLLTAAQPDRTSGVIGGYMVFYSLGSLSAPPRPPPSSADHGWAGSSLLGAGFAVCALAVWATARLRLGDRTGRVADRGVRCC